MAAIEGRSEMSLVVLLVAISWIPDISYGLQKHSISPFCTSTTDIDLTSDNAALIDLDWINYHGNMDCEIVVSVPPSFRLSAKVLYMDIDCSDSLTLYDGHSRYSQLTRLCGKYKPSDDFVTTDSYLLLVFKSDFMINGDGFKLLVTPFQTGICGSKFKCGNGRCIDRSFYCDDYDNCGDNSDECYMDHLWWVWMIVGIVIFIVICVVITVVCCCLCKRSRPGTVIRPNGQASTAVQYNSGAQYNSGIQYNSGLQTVGGVSGTNPWYGTPAPQTQAQPTYPAAYPPMQGTNQPVTYPTQPPPYSVSTSAYPAASNPITSFDWPAATTPDQINTQEKY